VADYPDWTRLFYLVGTAITIPINIKTSEVTLDVKLTASDVQLDVNIVAAAVTLDFNFADQSVAVFDAAKWFAHQAAQWSVVDNPANVPAGDPCVISRIVPAGKVAFIEGVAAGYDAAVGVVNIAWDLKVFLNFVAGGGFCNGGALVFDVPLRATAAQGIYFRAFNWSGAVRNMRLSIWGYDEDA